MTVIHIIFEICNYIFFGFTILITISYVVLGFISRSETKEYLRKNHFVNYKDIPSSSVSPTITIVAPAYNESLNIIESTRSLMSLHYVNYDIVVVNDGSDDDTLEELIKAYDLERVDDYILSEQLKTEPLRKGVFRSKNPAFEKLTVVDKENGGKSDALNMGFNISRSKYVVSIDVDCLLVEDALQRMVKPFLEETKKSVIASGGVIRLANACAIKDGRLLEVNLPKSMLVRAQIIEYLRAFLLGRMAWSRLNGLLVISGAFGLFDRKTVIEVGGYDRETVGEDMELVVRMRRYMEDKREAYKVYYIPDPLCWTEVPDDRKVFVSQRNRWTRGTIETLKKHRKLGLNRKYGFLGMISMPYWFIFERLAPIIEVVGIIYFTMLLIFRGVRWDYAIAFFVLFYLFSVIFSLVTLYAEELTFGQYLKKGYGRKLILMCFLEPFILHPLVLYAAIKGNFIYYFSKEKKWGNMKRKGLTNEHA